MSLETLFLNLALNKGNLFFFMLSIISFVFWPNLSLTKLLYCSTAITCAFLTDSTTSFIISFESKAIRSRDKHQDKLSNHPSPQRRAIAENGFLVLRTTKNPLQNSSSTSGKTDVHGQKATSHSSHGQLRTSTVLVNGSKP